mmetsp:Transcript_129977/g.417205  ORF Transcript_129977/g.417205 Transcript_129977/m.417205 type:complete len:241 (-) Transcript_129977:1340-2062(-)
MPSRRRFAGRMWLSRWAEEASAKLALPKWCSECCMRRCWFPWSMTRHSTRHRTGWAREGRKRKASAGALLSASASACAWAAPRPPVRRPPRTSSASCTRPGRSTDRPPTAPPAPVSSAPSPRAGPAAAPPRPRAACGTPPGTQPTRPLPRCPRLHLWSLRLRRPRRHHCHPAPGCATPRHLARRCPAERSAAEAGPAGSPPALPRRQARRLRRRRRPAARRRLAPAERPPRRAPGKCGRP